MKSFILTLSLFLLIAAAPAFAKFDPSFTWTTLETPHFRIHYHQGGEEIAKRTAQIAEDVYARLVPRIKWEPRQKTEVVLVDAMDEANGMTTVLPYNQMVLLLTQPVGEPGFGTTPYEEWMRLLITHEYTHVLQLDMINGGLGGVLQRIFGRLYFPNALQPEWLIEGLAVYEETAQTSGGRGRSAGADMVLRMATLEGPFPHISQMTVSPDTWPSGDVPYLFGDSFTQYIADTYGRKKLADLSLNYSGRGAPFLVNSTAKETFGSYYGKLYREWKESLQKKYDKQRADVRARGETTSTALTRKGYETISPVYSPDGNRIAYFESNGDEFPGIYIMNSDGTKSRKLIENVFPTSASGMSPAWSPDGSRLYYTKLEVVRNTNLYDDIYFYDLKSDREVRVTNDVRGRDPDPSADGNKLLFVTNRLGQTRLALLDLSSHRDLPAGPRDITYLTEEGVVQYETPRWSPDGSRIAVSVWQPGGYKDVWILDANGNKLEEATHDRANDGAPAWSPDGRYLYFTSDRTGIFNIFAYEVETKKLYQVTNVLGGAFSPRPSPDNRNLVFTGYSAKGYDVHAVAVDPGSWKLAAPYQDPYPAMQYEERRFETAERPYNPLPTLAPRFWLPWIGYSQRSVLGGFLTEGQDVAQRHEYVITGLYGTKTNHFWYTFDYFYDGLYPTIHLSASDIDATYTNLLQQGTVGDDYVERQQTYGLEAIFPLIKTQTQHAVSIGYQWKELSAITDVIPGVLPWPGYNGPVPFQGVLASGRASYLFNNSRRYDFSISPEQGRTLELGYERFDKSIGSDLEFNKYTADWHEYISMPWQHHVLQVRAFAGTSTGVSMNTFPQGAFQLGGDMPGDITLSINDHQVYLRGYPTDEFRGKSAALLSLEYRFPIWNIERGFGQTPFFFRRLHGAVFAEAGNTWDEGSLHESDAKRSVGAELRMDMDLGYYLPITVRLGFAKGLDQEGENQLILNAWMPLGF